MDFIVSYFNIFSHLLQPMQRCSIFCYTNIYCGFGSCVHVTVTSTTTSSRKVKLNFVRLFLVNIMIIDFCCMKTQQIQNTTMCVIITIHWPLKHDRFSNLILLRKKYYLWGWWWCDVVTSDWHDMTWWQFIERDHHYYTPAEQNGLWLVFVTIKKKVCKVCSLRRKLKRVKLHVAWLSGRLT